MYKTSKTVAQGETVTSSLGLRDLDLDDFKHSTWRSQQRS
jgi:hypothetical protein